MWHRLLKNRTLLFVTAIALYLHTSLHFLQLVHFFSSTPTGDKSDIIRGLGLDYYCGDADSDMTSAQKGGAWPFRILRSLLSNAPDTCHPGDYNEYIIPYSAGNHDYLYPIKDRPDARKTISKIKELRTKTKKSH